MQSTKRRKCIIAFTATTIVATILLAVNSYLSSTKSSSMIRKLSLRDLDSLDYNYKIEKAKHDLGCISRRNKLLYVHIPKTGGSTIEESELFDDARELAARGIRSPVKSHFPIWRMKQRGMLQFVTAATIRHPCERFISAFRYMTSPLANDSVQQSSKDLVGERNIDEFVKYMDENNWKPEKGNLLPHFYPLTSWVIDSNGSFGVDTILCQEQWNEGVERLLNKLNRTTTSDSDSSLYRHRLQNSGHGTCADLQPETRTLLERHYAMDYCLFGYESLPTGDNGSTDGKCIGTQHNKETMTLRYRDCQEKLALAQY